MRTRDPVRVLTAVAAVLVVAAALSSCIRPPEDTADDSLPVTWPSTPEVLPSPVSAVPPGFGAAIWALDPSFGAPTGTSTELHILVWERACSSGHPTTGRMSAPAVEYGSTSVTITIGVRARTSQFETCPLPQGTPAVVKLDEALLDRTLLDGGRAPISRPSPPA